MESLRPGSLAALRKALLWACFPLRPPTHSLGCWSGQRAGLSPVTMGSFMFPQRWASWLESSRRQREQEGGSGGTEFPLWNQGPAFKVLALPTLWPWASHLSEPVS